MSSRAACAAFALTSILFAGCDAASPTESLSDHIARSEDHETLTPTTSHAPPFAALPSLIWEEVASMPIALRGVTATADSRYVYVLGGATMNRGGGWVDRFQRYDPKTDTWTQLPSFNPPARDFAMAAVLPDGIHLVGGSRAGGPGEPANVLIEDHQVFDKKSGTWSPREPIPIALDAAVAHYVRGLLYVIGGGSPGGNIHGLVHNYDWRTDSWSTGTSMPTPRHTAASAVIGGKIHVVGGQLPLPAPGSPVVVDHQRYDPAKDSWEQLAPLPVGKAGLGGGTILGGAPSGRHFCVFGGIMGLLSAPGTVETFCYDPRADSWTQGPDMMTARGHPGFVAHKGAIYAIGGWTDERTVTATVERLRREKGRAPLVKGDETNGARGKSGR